MKPLPHVRRWFLGGIILFVVVGLAFVWGYSDIQRQDKHLRSLLVLFVAFSAFLVWVITVSGWRARHRWIFVALTVCAAAIVGATFRIRGVTGDLIPILEWRWKKHDFMVNPTSATPATAINARGGGSFPQFLGPARDGILAGPALATNWGTQPPKQLWRRSVGGAWSGFAIEGDLAITQEQRGSKEEVQCYNLQTGAPMWTHSDEARYSTTIAGEGPRSTPTISSNRVFTMGGTGILNCLDLATGKVLWTHNTLPEHGAKLPEWGVACSPLVTERAAIVTVGARGAAMVAYDRTTGELLWKSGQDQPHWCSPARVVLHETPQIVVFSESVCGYDEMTGKVLWQYPWPSPYPHVSTPIVLSSNRVLVSQGYGGGSEMLQVTHDQSRWKATRIWKSNRLKSKFANLIPLDGYVYGLDDGALVCIAADSGELKWKGERYGHGQMLLVGKLLLITAESGDIVLVDPNPTESRELTRFKVFSAKTWNPPALAGNLLLVRNDQEAACLSLPLK